MLAFFIVFWLLKDAASVVIAIYVAMLTLLWLVCKRIKFFTAFFITIVVSFFVPQILRGTHWALWYLHQLNHQETELLYDEKISEQPLISIVIPAYNYEKFVKKAVRSAATQDFDKPYEVVVLDDGSSDKTLDEILHEARKYPNVRVYRHAKNCGLIATKNQAIDLAKGEWIFNLDADDWLEKDALSSLYGEVEQNKADMVYTWFIYEGKKQGLGELCEYNKVIAENCVPNSILYQKSDWRKFGGYSWLFTKGLEDWDFWLNFKRANRRIARTHKAVYHYLIKENSRQNVLDYDGYSKSWWLLQAKYGDRLDWNMRPFLIFSGFDQRRAAGFHQVLAQYETGK